ncbi:MAG: AAA family ATPase [Candidatus Bathyarchaeota archaeon]|jgi:cytidylate kinase
MKSSGAGRLTGKRKEDLVITVSGYHGSGRSTHALNLAETFNLRYVSSGTIFREMAKERGLDLETMSKLTEEIPELDRVIDDRAKEASLNRGVVIDATLSGWVAVDPDLRIFLTAPLESRVKRIAYRENISLEEARRETQVRGESERERFLKYYDIDIRDLSIYDVILNTDLFEPEATARILKRIVGEYLKVD